MASEDSSCLQNLPKALSVYVFIHEITICFVGAFSNVVSLVLLFTCRRTGIGMRILLCNVFIPLTLVCVVTHPLQLLFFYETVTLNDDVSERFLEDGGIEAVILLHASLLTNQTITFALVALARLCAVLKPHLYKTIVTLKVVLPAVILMWIYLSTGFVATISGGLGNVAINNCTNELHIGGKDKPTSSTHIIVIFNFFLPVLITITCYGILGYKLRVNGSKTSSSNQRTDNANSSMLAVFISFLVLSVPHSISHMSFIPSLPTSSVYIHILYRIHFALDSILFNLCNPHFRTTLMSWLRSSVSWSQCCSTNRNHDELKNNQEVEMRKIDDKLSVQSWTEHVRLSVAKN